MKGFSHYPNWLLCGKVAITIIMMTLAGFPTKANPALKAGMKYFDDIVEVMAKISGRSISAAERKIISKQLLKASEKYGDDVIIAASKGGLELTEAAAKHGDEVWKLSALYPKAARQLAIHSDELLPLVRKLGPDILELEVKQPGITKAIVSEFGERQALHLAKTAPAAELPQLVGYAKRTNSIAAKKLLYNDYVKSDGRILKYLDWKTIMAGGLSVAGITAAYKTSDGIQSGLNTLAEKSPEKFVDASTGIVKSVTWPLLFPIVAFGFIVAGFLAWKFFRHMRSKVKSL